MALQPFTWGAGGQKITSPKQAEAQRRIAEALAKGTPAKNWAEGLANATGAWAGQAIEDRVAQAEAEGQQRAGGLFSSLAMDSSPDAIVQALTSPDAAWASDAQTSIASSLLNNQMERSDPMYQLQLEQAQLELENLRNGGGLGGSDLPSNVQEWQYYSELSPEEQAAYLTMKRSNAPLNVGTGFVTQNPAMPGTVMGPEIAINNEQAAYDSAFGGEAGKAALARIEALPQTISTSNNMITTIDGVLNDPALDYSTGWLAWMQAAPGTDQYRFGQRALQLQGQAFLQAFESLKGSGQITEVEGAKATQAIGRLSTAQAPDDYRAALLELRGLIEATKQRAASRVPGATAEPSPPPPGAGGSVDDILSGYGI